MAEAISNTSPLLYLHRAGVLEWIPRLFGGMWVSEDIQQRVLTLAGGTMG